MAQRATAAKLEATSAHKLGQVAADVLQRLQRGGQLVQC